MTVLEPAVVALGMFDGVHLGHRALMTRLLEEAKRLGAIPVVYTFSNHPLDVLGGNVPAERLYTGQGFARRGTVRMFYDDTGWTDYGLYEYLL